MEQEGVMTRFLLDDLSPADRAAIESRLIADPQYFEELAALEDDLILRWHRGELTDHEQRLFAASYLSSPSRQARVAAGRQLIDDAQRWEASESARRSVWNRLWQRRTPSWGTARFAMAGAVALVVVAVSVAPFILNDSTTRSVAVTLAPVGDRGTTENANLVVIPREADEVWLQFEVADVSATEGLDGMVESLTGAIVAAGSPVRVTRRADSSLVALTVPSRDLPDGDYVLRLRQASPAGGLTIIATRAFRVIHH